MKTRTFVVTILFVCLSFYFIIAQVYDSANYTVSVKVISHRNIPLNGILVWMQHNDGEKIAQYTDGAGNVKFTLVRPGEWSVNLPGLLNYEEYVLQEGSTGEAGMTIAYDLEEIQKKNDFLLNRPLTAFQTIVQDKLSPQEKADKTKSVLKVLLLIDKKPAGEGIPVRVVSVKHKAIYTAKTSKTGIAYLMIPCNDYVALDVDDVSNLSFVTVPSLSGTLSMRVPYTPTTINETIVNDTIEQWLDANAAPTTARSLVKIRALQSHNSPCVNERVFLSSIFHNKTYKAKTDNDGWAYFLLPMGDKYMIHFDYQPDVDVVNLVHAQGIARFEKQLLYSPDPRLQSPEYYMPSPNQVFINEFYTYLDKALPQPEKGEFLKLTAKWNNPKVNGTSKEALLNISLTTSKDLGPRTEVPVNIAFVIDRSGSMDGYGRIEVVKTSLKQFSKHLMPQDQVALVTFNEEPCVEIPLQAFGNGVNFNTQVDILQPNGGTNIYKGLETGYDLILNNKGNKHAQKVILLSDGYGITEPDSVVKMSKAYNQQGISLSAIGAGTGYNYSLLALLTSDYGNALIQAPDTMSLGKAFESEMVEMLYSWGDSCKIEIICNDAIEMKNLFGPKTKQVSKRKYEMNIGKLSSGYQCLALAHCTLNKPSERIELKPIKLKLSWYDTKMQKWITSEQSIPLQWKPSDGEYEMIIDRNTKKLYTIAIVNQSMKKMAEAYALNDYVGAKLAANRAMEQLKTNFPEADDADIVKLIREMHNYLLAIQNTFNKEKLEKEKHL